MADYSSLSNDDIMRMLQQQQPSSPPDYSKMSDQDILARLQARPAPEPSVAADVAKSAAIAVPEGVIQGIGTPGDIRSMMAAGFKKGADYLGVSPETQDTITSNVRRVAGVIPVAGASAIANGPTSADIRGAVEGVTGKFYQPQTTAGKFTNAAVSAASNPISYIGPGGVVMKAGTAASAGLGGEAGRELGQGTPYETPLQIAGSVLGGVAGAKTFSPAQPKAAVPTAGELKDIAGGQYTAARAANIEASTNGVGNWAGRMEQTLALDPKNGFTQRSAPDTYAILRDIQSPPSSPGTRAFWTAPGLDQIRRDLGAVAERVQPTGPGGAYKPTPDAAAAQIALKDFKGFLESDLGNHIVAGDPQAYVGNIKLANGNYAAGQRVADYDARLTKAERASDRQIAGSVDNQIKMKAGQMLDRGERGLGPDAQARAMGLTRPELDQLNLIETGGPLSNTLRHLGRGGAGVIPLGAHIATAVATGGAHLPLQVALAGGLYGARKGSEAITKSRAAKLAEMLAMRSPEYEARAAAIPQIDRASYAAALARALMAAPR